MECLKGFQINIIQGDSVQKNVVLVNVDKETIDSIYITNDKLNINKRLEYNSQTDKYVFYLSPSETKNLEVGLTDYDITIKFIDDNVKTVVYKSNMQVKPKTNKVVDLE